MHNQWLLSKFLWPYMTTKENYIDIDKLCDAKIKFKKKKKTVKWLLKETNNQPTLVKTSQCSFP